MSLKEQKYNDINRPTNPDDFVFSCLMVRFRVVEKVYLSPNGAVTFREGVFGKVDVL